MAQKIGQGAPEFLDPEILAHEAANYGDEIGELARALQNVIREMQRQSQQKRAPHARQAQGDRRAAEVSDVDHFLHQLRGLIDEFLSRREA